MKKQIKSLSVIAAITAVFSLSVNAQNVFPTPSGSVGIGTTSPAELLHVNGNVRGGVSGALRISTGSGTVDLGPQNTSWCHFVTDRSDFYFGTNIHLNGILSSYNGANLRLATGSGTNETLRLTILASNGNVGLGTANPDARLQVQGSLGSIAEAGKISLDILQWSNSNIGWNSFYQGFNISRSSSSSNWTTGSDGVRNGAVALLTNLGGDIHFVGIPTSGSGTTPAVLSDAQVSAAIKMKIQNDGQVLIGNPATVTMPGGYKLYVETGILTEKLKVAIKGTSNWSDYVFSKNYKLTSLEELESYVQKNKHLPNIPSAEEMVKDGLDVAEMDAKLLEKIEELTLHVIELNKKNIELNKKIEGLANNFPKK